MKSAYVIALFTASTQAISMETMSAFVQGDSDITEYDPLNTAGWISRDGRDDRVTTDEGLRENVLVYEDDKIPDSELTPEEIADAKHRPMCNVGGVLDKVDLQGPSDPCCRVYEKDNFMGLHYDFCHYGGDLDMTERYYQADQFGWHNEINSYKCGKDVNIRLCQHTADGSTFNAANGECNPGNDNVHEGKEAGRLPLDVNNAETVNKHDSIWIFKCNNCAMVYEDENCNGDNFMVRPDINHLNAGNLSDYQKGVDMAKEKGSWDFYDHTFHPILEERRSKSVMLPLEMEFEFFEGDRVFEAGQALKRTKERDFTGSKSYTIRNLGKKTNAAAPLASCYNFAQMVKWWDETNLEFIDWNSDKPAHMKAALVKDQVSGVSGIKIREQWMPEV